MTRLVEAFSVDPRGRPRDALRLARSTLAHADALEISQCGPSTDRH